MLTFVDWRKNCHLFTPWRTNHTLSPLFAIYFDEIISKNVGVSVILTTSEKRCSSFWLIEIQARRARLCRVKPLFTQSQLAENDGLCSCRTSSAFFWNLKMDIGKCKANNAEINVSISSSSLTGKISSRHVPGKLNLLESLFYPVPVVLWSFLTPFRWSTNKFFGWRRIYWHFYFKILVLVSWFLRCYQVPLKMVSPPI